MMANKLKRLTLRQRPLFTSMGFKKVKVDDNTIYEGEVDYKNTPNGIGCMIKFIYPIKGISWNGML